MNRNANGDIKIMESSPAFIHKDRVSLFERGPGHH
jgi:hypothetical protein